MRCADTFHIVQWAAELLDELRKQLWRKAAPKGRRVRPRKGEGQSRKEGRCIREGPQGPLLKNPESLTEGRRRRFSLPRSCSRGSTRHIC